MAIDENKKGVMGSDDKNRDLNPGQKQGQDREHMSEIGRKSGEGFQNENQSQDQQRQDQVKRDQGNVGSRK